MKRKGIIKLVPAKEPKKDDTIIYVGEWCQNVIYKVVKTFHQPQFFDLQNFDLLWYKDIYSAHISELYTLVVEYEEEWSIDLEENNATYKDTGTMILSLPIRQSDWRFVLDGDLINKEVEFEAQMPYTGTGIPISEISLNSDENTIAVIVEKKERTYTESEVNDLLYYLCHRCGLEKKNLPMSIIKRWFNKELPLTSQKMFEKNWLDEKKEDKLA